MKHSTTPKRTKIFKGGEEGAVAAAVNEIKTPFTYLVILFIYFAIILFVAVSFNKMNNSREDVSVFLFLVILLTLFFLVFTISGVFKNQISPQSKWMIKISIYVILFIIVVSCLFSLSQTFSLVILTAGIIVILAILFNIFRDYFVRSNKNERLRFFFEFVFYIPCLFNDFVAWILDQFKLTPYITYVLFFIEFLLIIAYIYFPRLMTRINTHDGKLLQNEPYYFNSGKEKVVASDDDLNVRDLNSQRQKPAFLSRINPFQLLPEWLQPEWAKSFTPERNNLLEKTVRPANYAFSMWIILTPQPVSRELTIFKYGYTDSYKPKITYDNDDIYRVYFTNNQFFEITVPNQKWNHFVVNYVEGVRAELWVNGKMKKVFSFSEIEGNMPRYDPSDQVIIGNTENTGLNGAIANLLFFNKTLDSRTIVNMYNIGNPRFPETPRV